MLRALGVILLVITIIGGLVYAVKDFVFKEYLENIIEDNLSVKVRIDRFHSSLGLGQFRAEGITIYNPEGFGHRVAFYIPSLTMTGDVLKMIDEKTLHFYVLDFEIEKINIVKNMHGNYNLQKLAESSQRSGEGRIPFKADYMRFDLKGVFLYDETTSPPKVQAFPVELTDLSYQNLDSFDDTLDIISREVVAKVKDRALANFPRKSLVKSALGHAVAE